MPCAERGARAAIATGSARRDALEPLPAEWLVAPSLPQVTLLAQAAAAVTHGGNNSVTECLHAGVPMVVLPFSTDQFATAADLERTGLATAVNPNGPLGDALPAALDDAHGQHRQHLARRMAKELTTRPGPSLAVERLHSH